jgi:hypothetical protein
LTLGGFLFLPKKLSDKIKTALNKFLFKDGNSFLNNRGSTLIAANPKGRAAALWG